MGLINSKDAEALKNMSDGGTSRKAGLFMNTYITGVNDREGETYGKMQVVSEWEEKSPKFLLNDQEKLNLIIMFIKRIRQMAKKVPPRNQDKIVCFSFNDAEGSISSSGRSCPSGPDRQNGFCDDCRYQYIIAGALLDDKYKPIKKEDGETALVYFRNAGMKFMPVADFLDEIQEKCKDLPALSDDEEFEKQVVCPRRFITQITVQKLQSEHGPKNAIKYVPARTSLFMIRSPIRFLTFS